MSEIINYAYCDKLIEKFEKVIEQGVDFAVKLIHNSMRSIKSGELSPEFFLGLVDFVDDVDFLWCGNGRDLGFFAQGADVIDAVVAGGINFDDIQM